MNRCVLCEQLVEDALEYYEDLTLPHPLKQWVCQDCKRFLKGIGNGDVKVYDMTEEYEESTKKGKITDERYT